MLGQRDELVGRDVAQHRMLPAQQGLHVRHALRAQVDFRLVEHPEFIAFAGRPQVADQADPAQVGFVVAGLVDRDPALRLLGFVHGDVGAAQQRVRVGRMQRIQGQADARADADLGLSLAQVQRRFQCADDRPGAFERARFVGSGDQHQELVAAQPRQLVVLVDRVAQPPPDFLQHAVAERVAQGVVDFLEAIQVEQQHRASRVAGARLRERRFEQGQRMHPVGQAGEGVVLGLVADPLFAFGDAALHAVERIGQVGELVVADHGQGLGIVAALDPACGIGQPRHRAGHAAAHDHGHHQREHGRQRGQQHDLPFQVLVRQHRGVHAGQQEHVDRARMRRIGRGGAGMEFAIGQGDPHGFARRCAQLHECVRGVGVQAAGHQPPAVRLAHADGRVQAGQ